MQLIGMLDSPFVRRTAIAFDCLGIAFEHKAVSVFSTFEQFQKINPVVKAPTLICDDGTVLMDSSLILQYAETIAPHGASLWSPDGHVRRIQFQAVGLAQAACEKSAQIVYERNLRPKTAQHEPWIDRITGQLIAAYAGLERVTVEHTAIFNAPLNHASISAAVAWQFTQSMLTNIIPAMELPSLVQLSKRLEQTPAFIKYPPDGPGVPTH